MRQTSKTRRTIGIRGQLMGFLCFICLLLVGLFWFLSTQLLEPLYTTHIQKQLTEQAEAIVARMDEAIGKGETLSYWAFGSRLYVNNTFFNALQDDIFELGGMSSFCIDISDTTLRQIFKVDNLAYCNLHRTRPTDTADEQTAYTTARAMRQLCRESGGTVVRKINPPTPSGSVQLMVGRMTSDGNYTVLVTTSLMHVAEAGKVLSTVLPLAAALIFAFSMSAAWLFSEWFTKPLRALSGAARQVAQGNYAVHVDSVRNDELGDLAQEFNHMAKEVQHASQMQRDLLANVSHDLRTPLTLIKGYAETVRDLTGDDKKQEAVQQGKPVPALDLEEDILHGIMIQFALIVTVLGVAIVLTMRFISGRLWQPFDKTLEAIEHFKLENGVCPQLAESDTKEFVRLNIALQRLMTDSLHSYRLQKEFTENASHELQTPLAVFQSKLDLLLQQPELTERQAAIIQDLYQMNSRLSRLNRNLLLLAKMENNQFSRTESVDVITVIKDLQPYLESLSGGLILKQNFSTASLPIKANRSLLESMVNNLVVNAVRHNKTSGEITVFLSDNRLMVSNTSDDAALDADQIFNRFYRPSEKTTGNGLGLSIVKAVCDYHGWKILYAYADGKHQFVVIFR